MLYMMISMMLIINMFFMFLMLFNVNINYLNFLIYMEFVILSILFTFLIMKMNIWFFLSYITFSVCEAVLGLSLLVSMNFEYGHQKINLINLC